MAFDLKNIQISECKIIITLLFLVIITI